MGGGGGSKKAKVGILGVFRRTALFPINWFFWLVQDKLAGGDIPFISDLVMKKTKFKEYIPTLKEMRLVLCEYFKVDRPERPEHQCATCREKSAFYCVESKKEYCAGCATRYHAKGLRAELFSVEEISHGPESTGTHILTPMLAEIIAFCLLIYVLRHGIITKEYLHATMCPVVSFTRRMSATINANAYYHLKSYFASACDAEDSFYKLILDLWVRDIVTDTDNTVLVWQAFSQAFLFDLFALFILVPIFATLYAALFTIIYKLECSIPRTEVTETMEKIAESLDFFSHPVWGCTGTAHEPPPTHWRQRRAKDSLDRLYYWWDRKVRYFHYFYENCKAAVTYFLWQVTTVAILLRLGCIWFGLAGPLRWLCRLFGLSRKMRLHRKWFKGASGAIDFDDDWLGLDHVHGASSWVLGWVPESFLHSAKIAIVTWLILAILTTILILVLAWHLVKEQRQFKAKWKVEADKALTFHPHDAHGKH